MRAGRTTWGSRVAAALLVAVTYFHFLIFAEFALLEIARELTGGDDASLNGLLAVLGAGGLAGSAAAAWRFRLARWRWQLAGGLVGSAAAAGWAVAGTAMTGTAALTGLSLGWLTVILAAGLRAAVWHGRLGMVIGLGTGAAYGLANLPWVFLAGAKVQALLAATTAVAACLLLPWLRPREEKPEAGADHGPGGLVRWMAILAVLVWLDSAAFYLIQHRPELKVVTWSGSGRLWLNAVVHVLLAVLAGAALDRGWRAALPVAAGTLLAAGCLLLAGPHAAWASPCYVAGVSIYSVVLVFYPASSGRAGHAGLVYAVAGWIGSALGIGMARDLHRVPGWFLAAAGLVIAATTVWRRRANRAVPATMLAMLALGIADLRATGSTAATPALIERGREVYIAEGCIHCHSQFLRPRTADVVRWGPVPAAADSGAPRLLGNRRQGPDLTAVGARRSDAWQRLHLMAPRKITPGSRMPSYAHLFAPGEGRGEALVSYLGSLGAGGLAAHWTEAGAWSPAAVAPIGPAETRRVFTALCASCHGADGRGEGPLAAELPVRPADLARRPWKFVPPGGDEAAALARIVRFGLAGSVMAGHETLADAEVLGLVEFLRQLPANTTNRP